MMRRTVLLLVTVALVLIAAGGIALAATFTCTTSPCDGTADADVITGTVNAETINGQAGDDDISARDANDTLNGEDGNDTMHGDLGDDHLNGGGDDDSLTGDNGTDWLFGEAGNDRLDAGGDLQPDYYVFGADWGSDTITDGGGNADEVRGNTPSLADPPIGNLKVNLVSSDTSAEFTDGTNTADWSGSVIDRAVTGPGNDEISQRPGGNDSMFARGGSDTYKGYDPSASAGFDFINDGGLDSAVDQLDLARFNLSDVSWSTQAGTTGNIRDLIVSFDSGGRVTLVSYFNNSSTDACASGLGPSLIETIGFADDPSVDFAQVKRLLGCTPSDTTPPMVNSTSPVDNATSIATTAVVDAFFSEEMDRSTLTTGTFTLTKQGSSTPISARVEYFSTIDKALLTPSSVLEANTTYTATVKGGPGGAKDLAGNALAQDYSWTFTTTGADTTPPQTIIDSGPSGYVKGTSASLSFSSSEAGSTFQCSLDAAPFTACTSPESYPNLAQGSHTFRVGAIDAAGNPDTTPASRSWFVDTVAPKGTISINGGSASTPTRSVTLKLSASDPSPASGVASMRFRNGGTSIWSSWSSYSTSKSWTLTAGAGTKTVYVQYRDRARNISAASDTIRFSP